MDWTLQILWTVHIFLVPVLIPRTEKDGAGSTLHHLLLEDYGPYQTIIVVAGTR